MELYYSFFAGAEVKAKWRNIRDNFRKELNKESKCRSGDEGGKKTKWVYFEAMLFLSDSMTGRPSSGNIEMPVIPSPDNADFDQTNNSDVDTEELENNDKGNEGEKDEESECFRTPRAQKRVNEEKIASQSKKRKKEPNIYDRMLALEEKKLEKLSSMTSQNENNNYNNDSDYMFFMSLLPQMKTLSPLRNMYMRLKIQQLFITEQEMLLSNTNSHSSVATPLPSPSSHQSSSYTSNGMTTATYDNNFLTSENDHGNANEMFPTTSNSSNVQTYFSNFQ